MANLWHKFWRTKDQRLVCDQPEPDEKSNGLSRVLGPVDLTILGVGSIVGAGIFVLAGVAAKEVAGPAVAVSFALDAIACFFSALCYAELSSRIPVAGSAFSYAYIAMGEGPAMIIGWSLLLEYAFAISAVSRGLSGYLVELVRSLLDEKAQEGFPPEWLVGVELWGALELDLLAAVLVVALTAVLLIGLKQSRFLNSAATVLSVIIVLFVIGLGAAYAEPANWKPFAPYGVEGIFSAASVVFFAFIGFDVVANCAEEVKKPSRDVPLGLLSSLAIVAVLYIGVALAVTGLVPYTELDVKAPLAEAFRARGLPWASSVISVGAVAGLVTTMFASHVGATRIVFALSRDGLLPSLLAKVSLWSHDPYIATSTVGALTTVLALFLDIELLSELVSAGTLVAFLCVCLTVLFFGLDESKAGQLDVSSGGEGHLSLWHQRLAFQKKLLGASLVAVIALEAAAAVGAKGVGNYALPLWTVLTLIVLLLLLLLFWILCFFYFRKSNRELVSTVDPVAPFESERDPVLLPTRNTFRCPFVPFIPLAGVLVNVYLLASLSGSSWLGFSVWSVAGMVIYFTFGMRNSKLNEESVPFLGQSPDM